MRNLGTISLLAVLVLGCASEPKSKEPFLTPEQDARLREIILKRLNDLPANIRLSPQQIEAIAPIVEMHAQRLFDAAAAYQANPTPDRLRSFSRRGYEIQQQMRKDLAPMLTSAQLYNFLAVFDKTLQDVRAMRQEPR
jgi:hypothetical protein